MSLLITLKNYTSGSLTDTFIMKVDSLTHEMARAPTQAGLPGDTDTNGINIFGLDLGICTERIAITGIVDEVSQGTNEPSKSDLEDAMRSWWTEETGEGSDAIGNSIYLKTTTTRNYWGMFAGCQFSKDGALEDRWQFSLSFLILTYSDNY
jgi:hypothetical protein